MKSWSSNRGFAVLLVMNFLRIVAQKDAALSPALTKLQNSCKDDGTCSKKIDKEDLKNKLSPLQYRVTQEKGTERAFSGKYVKWNAEGVFICIVCNNTIFHSEHKFDSKSGWPSFSDVIDQGRVRLVKDFSHGLQRLEVQCAKCKAHLGHVFDDGPKPSCIRYCVNSASLDFRKHTTV